MEKAFPGRGILMLEPAAWEPWPRGLISFLAPSLSLPETAAGSYPLLSTLGCVRHQDGGFKFSRGDDGAAGAQGEDGVPAAEGWL